MYFFSAFSWTTSPVFIISSNPFAIIGLPLGVINKKSGVVLFTKNEPIFWGAASSYNKEIICSFSILRFLYNIKKDYEKFSLRKNKKVIEKEQSN